MTIERQAKLAQTRQELLYLSWQTVYHPVLNRETGARSNKAVFYSEGTWDKIQAYTFDPLRGFVPSVRYVWGVLTQDRALMARATWEIDKITSWRVSRYLTSRYGKELRQAIHNASYENPVLVEYHNPKADEEMIRQMPRHVGLGQNGRQRVEATLYHDLTPAEKARAREVLEYLTPGYQPEYVFSSQFHQGRLREVVIPLHQHRIAILSRADYARLTDQDRLPNRRPARRR